MDGLTVVTWRLPRVNAAHIEAATLPEKERDAHLRAILGATGAKDLVYVPTCQRVVLALREAEDDVVPRIAEHYAATLQRDLAEPEFFRGYDAFRHLAETAASLDSLVVGEPQVLGQYKAAAAQCDEWGLCGPAMRHVFSQVFRAAKAVRSETELFRGKVSLVPLTESLLRKHLAGKPTARVAVLGTGQIGQRMAEMLQATHPHVELHVVSRDPVRAAQRAGEMGGTGHALARFLESPPEKLDVLALAMTTDTPILSAKAMEAMALETPLLVLDLAIPRNAETAQAQGLTLVQMDDLVRQSQEARAGREAELASAHAVLERELARIKAEYEARKLAHDLADLNERFQRVAAERLVQSPAGVDAAFEKWYEQTVRALLHEATGALKRAGCERRAK